MQGWGKPSNKLINFAFELFVLWDVLSRRNSHLNEYNFVLKNEDRILKKKDRESQSVSCLCESHAAAKYLIFRVLFQEEFKCLKFVW